MDACEGSSRARSAGTGASELDAIDMQTRSVCTEVPIQLDVNLQSMETFGIEVLDVSRNIESFIDDKIKERKCEGSEVPFHVANLDNIFKKHLKWLALLPRVTPFYAVKCNNSPAVLRTLSALGTGFDCASKGEIEMVKSVGVTPDRIIYAHTTKPQSHIRYACAQKVDIMTFDNEEELKKIKAGHPNAKLVLRIVVDDSSSHIKLNSEFGASLETVGGLLKLAQELHLDITGVSFHVGSVCTDSVAYERAIEDARFVFDQASLLGFHLELLDIGGGFTGTELHKMSKGINKALDEFFPVDSGVKVIAEPGRYFVDSAFTLALNVFAKRHILSHQIDQKDSYGSDHDSLFMYYVTDGVFGSFGDIRPYPDVTSFSLRPQRPVKSSEPRYRSIVWGPSCDSIDRIRDLEMPELNIGDWILVDNIGAYTITLSTDFNSFEKPIVYPVVTAPIWKMLNCNM